MKIIIPMAGRGSRLRPHTLTTPKPLIPIAGKPIVHRLVEDIAKVCSEKIDEIAFVIGDFGAEVEADLIAIAEKLGAKGTICHQLEPLGTAHSIWMAKEALDGPTVVAYADTLFRADFKLDMESDGVVWVKQVDNPSAFGVVKLDDNNVITDFVEKPKEFVSDLAIIGIYFFRDGQKLYKEIEYLLENDIQKGGEYQLTDALENMRAAGDKFTLGKVDQWMDCGNKAVTVDTNTRVLNLDKEDFKTIHSSAKIDNSLIIEPCFIGENVVIKNSKIGPFVSLGNGTVVENSNIDNSLIQENSIISNANLTDTMIGNNAKYYDVSRSISLGDYSELDFKSHKA
ncbi:sugar phosphate nucleotidyltransferase [Empedobacter falsenii]